MDLGIAGRRAIVAGGSAGMGKGAALALATEGAELVIAARGTARLEAAAEEIAGLTGAKVVTVCADHASPEGRAALAAACPDPDILVITSSPPRPIDDFRSIEPADWIESVAAGMVGPIELIRTFIDGMCARRFGRIVVIATIAAKHPAEFRLLSGPPRAALINYAGAVARKVAQHDVVFNTLLPGMVLTETQQERFRIAAERDGVSFEEAVDRYAERWRIPTRRLGDPDDIGAIAAMLCSRQANFIVGQSIVVDGGMTSGMF